MKAYLVGTAAECAEVVEILRQCPAVAVTDLSSQYANRGEVTDVRVDVDVWVRAHLPVEPKRSPLR